MYLFVYDDGTSWYSTEPPTPDDLKLIKVDKLQCFCSVKGELRRIGVYVTPITGGGELIPHLIDVPPGVVIKEESGTYTVSEEYSEYALIKGEATFVKEVGLDAKRVGLFNQQDLDALVKRVVAGMEAETVPHEDTC